MKYVLFATTLVIVLTGCATVRTVDLDAPSVRYQVTLVDGRQFEAMGLRSTATSLSWVDPETGIGHAFPRSQVQALTYTEEGVSDGVSLSRITSGSSGVVSIYEINTQAQQQRAQVRLVGGAVFIASGLQVTPDSTSWLDPYTDHVETVATEEIWEITFFNRGQGAVEGAGIGVLTGAAVAAMGATPSIASFAAVLFGGSGGLLGLTVGAAVGHRHTYRFNRPVPEPQVAQQVQK